MEKSVTFNWKLDVCFICTRYLVLWSEGEWEFAADEEVVNSPWDNSHFFPSTISPFLIPQFDLTLLVTTAK